MQYKMLEILSSKLHKNKSVQEVFQLSFLLELNLDKFWFYKPDYLLVFMEFKFPALPLIL